MNTKELAKSFDEFVQDYKKNMANKQFVEKSFLHSIKPAMLIDSVFSFDGSCLDGIITFDEDVQILRIASTDKTISSTIRASEFMEILKFALDNGLELLTDKEEENNA